MRKLLQSVSFRITIVCLLLLFFSFSLSAKETALALSKKKKGKVVSPITDICWGCLFPIHIAGKNATTRPDLEEHEKALCSCKGGIVGVPFSFWEPSHIVEVTRTPYRFVSLGGLQMASNPIKKGTITNDPWGSKSFYHVHYIAYPFTALLDLGIDFVCADKLPFDIGYMSEFDPFWNDDTWSAVLNPEVFLFANPLAQAACVADCAAASFGKPLNTLFWCAGCQGSLYPLSGHSVQNVGGIQASSLLVHRLLAKLASIRFISSFKEKDYCKKSFSRILRKNAFKTQLAWPKAQTKGNCNALGKSTILWESGKNVPFGGEEFAYLIWEKKHCCVDPVKISKKFIGGLNVLSK